MDRRMAGDCVLAAAATLKAPETSQLEMWTFAALAKRTTKQIYK